LLTKQVEGKDKEIMNQKSLLNEKDRDVEEMQMKILDIKSQLIERDS
jgi:hypothetical protein